MSSSNGHGGNYVLSNITQQANVDGRHVALFPSRSNWETASMSTAGHGDMHGGELETSLLLHAHPDLARDSYRTADHEASDRPHLLVTGMTEYTDNGSIGRPPWPTRRRAKRRWKPRPVLRRPPIRARLVTEIPT